MIANISLNIKLFLYSLYETKKNEHDKYLKISKKKKKKKKNEK